MKRLHSNVADVLYHRAIHFVRPHKMSFYKFWWSQELNILKESSVTLVRFLKVAGRRGRIYQNSNVDIKAYRNKALFKNHEINFGILANEV